MLKISCFTKNVVYFDSNAGLNIFRFLHPNHFGPGLKHLQLHCFGVYVNPNFCMKYLVVTVYVVFKFNSIPRRNKKVSNDIKSIFTIGIAVVRDLDPGRSFSPHERYHGANLFVFPKSGDFSINISALGSGITL